jgi:hypothetical protein
MGILALHSAGIAGWCPVQEVQALIFCSYFFSSPVFFFFPKKMDVADQGGVRQQAGQVGQVGQASQN